MSQQESSTPVKQPNKATKQGAKLSDAKRRKQDALELATLLYDMYKHEQINVSIKGGQSNDNVS